MVFLNDVENATLTVQCHKQFVVHDNKKRRQLTLLIIRGKSVNDPILCKIALR